MTRSIHKTSVALLLGTPVRDAGGRVVGHLQEFAVTPSADTGHVSTLLVRSSGGSTSKGSGRKAARLAIDVRQISLTPTGEIRLLPDVQPSPLESDNDLLMLERDLLDQQIIDVHGHKVVRVNDVCLAWESSADQDGSSVLRIHEVEVGMRGAIRRLLKGLPSASIEK